MAAFKVLVALDDSPSSRAALEWAANSWSKGAATDLHLVTVVAPVVAPTVPLAAGAALAMVNTQQWVASTRREEDMATQLISDAAMTACGRLKVPQERVTTHVLRPTGGASGVAASVVVYAETIKPDIVIVGSRGMGSLKSSVMSLVGLGSVSDYLLHNIEAPVLVVNPRADVADGTHEGAAADPHNAGLAPPHHQQHHRQIVISLDESAQSQAALAWSLDHVLQPDDELHLISVAPPSSMPVLEDAGAMLSTREHEADQRTNWDVAKHVVAKGAAAAVAAGVPASQVTTHPLLPQGGACDVGASVTQYARLKRSNLVVLGSRGMGAVKRTLMGFLGLGSVSDYVVHNAPCPVLVVRHSPGVAAAHRPPAAAPPTSGQVVAVGSGTSTPAPATSAVPSS